MKWEFCSLGAANIGRILSAGLAAMVCVAGGSGAVSANDLSLPTLPVIGDSSMQHADAASLLSVAKSKFEAGNLAAAQQFLVALMDRFPNAPEAELARGLHRQVLAKKFEAQQRSALGAGSGLPATEGAAITSGWQAQVRRLVPPQNRLVEAAGDRIFFSASSAELGEKARRVLKAQARWLKANRGFGFEIAGHADEPGSSAANIALSLKRAEAVRDRLRAEGVPASRLRVVGLGRDQRVAVCSFAACLAQNRRVISRVTYWSRGHGLQQLTQRR
ncbi:MAG TPA: OmpA family protein [Hyphomicrobiaceae bacterium]|nr:OmpA family protein [Hyphomicrobiaceae bacterium]